MKQQMNKSPIKATPSPVLSNRKKKNQDLKNPNLTFKPLLSSKHAIPTGISKEEYW